MGSIIAWKFYLKAHIFNFLPLRESRWWFLQQEQTERVWGRVAQTGDPCIRGPGFESRIGIAYLHILWTSHFSSLALV